MRATAPDTIEAVIERLGEQRYIGDRALVRAIFMEVWFGYPRFIAGDADAPQRRDRPLGRGVRGLPAGAAERLPDLNPGAGDDPRQAAAVRRHHLQPHPGGPRRAQAALSLPLDRLSERGQGDRDRPR